MVRRQQLARLAGRVQAVCERFVDLRLETSLDLGAQVRLAAEDAVIRTLTRPGDHVVLPGDAYGGTYRLFARVAEPWGVGFSTASSDPAAVAVHDASYDDFRRIYPAQTAMRNL